MSNFEGTHVEDIGSFETGSRPGIDQETKSYFDETLDQAIDEMKSGEHYRVPDVINRLDNNTKATKEALAQALNMNGFDWRILGKVIADADSEKAVSDAIVAWAEETELAADNQAIRAAGQAFAQKIENL